MNTQNNTSVPFDPYVFERTEIHGIPIYYKFLPWAPCLFFNFVVNTGALFDPAGKQGLSHFLEHMLFAGSPLVPNKKAYQAWSKQYTLNSSNAMTTHRYTMYDGKCLPEHFDQVVPVVTDIIVNPYIRPEDVENERKVIIQEAWGRYENDKRLQYSKSLAKNIYHGTLQENMNRPLGYPETVEKISREDIVAWHKRHYVRENMFIVLAGNVTDAHLKLLEQHIDKIPHGTVTPLQYGTVGDPLELRWEKNAHDLGMVQKQVSVSVRRTMPSFSWHERTITSEAVSLLQDVLHEALRLEQSLCYGVSVNFTANRYAATLEIEVDTSVEHKDKAEQLIWQKLDEIIAGNYADRSAVIHKLRLDRIRSAEYLSADLADFAVDEISDSELHSKAEVLAFAETITYKDIQKILARIFEKNKVFTKIILPSRE